MNCLECGEKIYGRSDKKFCSDGCRNAYNNKQNSTATKTIRTINNKLRKNYRILLDHNFTEGKAKTTKSKLTAAGFEFDYFTSLKVYKNGAEYFFVYNIGYKFLEDDRLLLVHNE